MKTIFYPAASRGRNHTSWLNTYYSFSFAHYYDPQRMGFGQLRVLNDDTMAGGKGFGAHPHDNMEIITIPLEGVLQHQDNTGGKKTLSPGEVQRMTAGSGIVHSEINASPMPVKLLQIWIMPRLYDIAPRYDQKKFDFADNQLTLIASPDGRDDSLDINQHAYLWLGRFSKDTDITLPVEKGQGIFLFVIEGQVDTPDQHLQKRDAEGIYDAPDIPIKIKKDTHLLVINVPMEDRIED